jgi:hypothetical protein
LCAAPPSSGQSAPSRAPRSAARVLVVTATRVVVHDPRPACAAEADRVHEGAVALPRDHHGRAERGEEVQLVHAVTVLVVGVVDGFLQRDPRLVLLGAVVQAPSLGLARVGRERESPGSTKVRPSHGCARNSACIFYIGTIRSTQSEELRKASKASMSYCHVWSHLKGLYGGLHFTLALLLLFA